MLRTGALIPILPSAARCQEPRPDTYLGQDNLTPAVLSGYLDVMSDATRFATEMSSKDPAVGLRAVASLRALLHSLEQLQVENARAQGWSWQQIATALGVSKQAVHEKHGSGRRLLRRPAR